MSKVKLNPLRDALAGRTSQCDKIILNRQIMRVTPLACNYNIVKNPACPMVRATIATFTLLPAE